MTDNLMVISVAELRERLNSIFHDIIPEAVARRCQSGLRSFSSNQEFEKARLEAKEAVSQLLEQIANMEKQPIHKIQTLVRKSPLNVQIFLMERVVFMDNQLRQKDPNETVTVPSGFGEFLRAYLIEEYNRKLEDTP